MLAGAASVSLWTHSLIINKCTELKTLVMIVMPMFMLYLKTFSLIGHSEVLEL